MTSLPTIRVYKARVVHSLALGKLEVLEPGAVGVDEDGRVLFCKSFPAFRAWSEAPALISSADESTENELEHEHEREPENEHVREDEHQHESGYYERSPKRRRRRFNRERSSTTVSDCPSEAMSDVGTMHETDDSSDDGTSVIGGDRRPTISLLPDAHFVPLKGRVLIELVDLGSRLLMPGFVDGHAHAPQYSIAGIGTELPLLQWLEKYTFPTEARFADAAHARRVYGRAVRRHVSCGTTTCSYFGTLHLEASKVLADVVEQQGQRALVGKVSMDRNAPDFYVERSAAQSLRDTRAFVEYVQAKRSPTVEPVITPRFVPTCSDELLRGLAHISRTMGPKRSTAGGGGGTTIGGGSSSPGARRGIGRGTARAPPGGSVVVGQEWARAPLAVQSHLSESLNECAWVRELAPEADHYADVYDRAGLLHERSYMAHCVHCCPKERAALRESGAAVIHCPNSNFTLSSGILNVRRMLREGVKVGLGTDVSGGYSCSMLDAIRHAITASKMVSIGKGCAATGQAVGPEKETENENENENENEIGEGGKDVALSYAEAFHLATAGGADAVGLGERVGNFSAGKEFDALVVNPAAADSPFDLPLDGETTLNTFERFLFTGDDRNIERVFVRGRQIK